MDAIKLELKKGSGQHVVAEISLDGDGIENYLTAFKAFLMACGFAESTIAEIQMMEDARFMIDKEREENNV